MCKSEFKVSIPDGFENDVRKVESGAYATAIIDNSGQLKFWFNSPFQDPATIKTFHNYSNGKISLSNKFLCAIDDFKQLSCYRATPTKIFEKLSIPSQLVEDVVDVSAGNKQICAISSQNATICWE